MGLVPRFPLWSYRPFMNKKMNTKLKLLKILYLNRADETSFSVNGSSLKTRDTAISNSVRMKDGSIKRVEIEATCARDRTYLLQAVNCQHIFVFVKIGYFSGKSEGGQSQR